MSECMCGDIADEVCDGCWKTNLEAQVATLRAEVARLRSALRLLWEEAQDESRCQVESGYGHLISQRCWETVTAALKEGDR